MTWPSSDVDNTNTASGSTPGMPALFRVNVRDLITKFNEMRNHVSTFMRTVLDDVDAASARATLGIKTQSFSYSNTAENTSVGTSFVDLTLYTTVQKGSALLGSTFTAPRTGWIRVCIGGIDYYTSSGTVTSVGVRVKKNASYENPESIVATEGARTGLVYIAQVTAGDTIKIGARSYGTSPVAVVTCTGVEIAMIDYE